MLLAHDLSAYISANKIEENMIEYSHGFVLCYCSGYDYNDSWNEFCSILNHIRQGFFTVFGSFMTAHMTLMCHKWNKY